LNSEVLLDVVEEAMVVILQFAELEEVQTCLRGIFKKQVDGKVT
jgi:hypothetical protein